VAVHYANLQVSDLARTGSFYDAVLAPLGWRRQAEEPGMIAWGLIRPDLVVTEADAQRPGFGHISLPAKSIPAVKASFESGLQNGGRADAEPGTAPMFGAGNYAARLIDPDGYRIEVCVAHE
jgi:catechol 2,3-dioxygenase-like lactoylglutathione lyase family enzyme